MSPCRDGLAVGAVHFELPHGSGHLRQGAQRAGENPGLTVRNRFMGRDHSKMGQDIFLYLTCNFHVIYLVCGNTVGPLISILCCSYRPPSLKLSPLRRRIRSPTLVERGIRATVFCFCFTKLSLDCEFHEERD